MKQRLLLLLTLFLTACAVAETGTAVPLTITPEVTPSPYSTAAPPLAQVTATTEPTDIPPIPTLTTAPTDTPQPTPTPIPPPTGHIYFLWDPAKPIEGYPLPVANLYRATPGQIPEEWAIEIMIPDLHGYVYTALSPDKTKLALTAYEDTNNDGLVISSGPITDAPNIFIYSLITYTLERLTTNFPQVWDLTWSSDNQRLAYQNGKELFIAYPESGEIELLATFPDYVQTLTWSPDGRYLAISSYGDDIYLYDSSTGGLINLNVASQGINLAWSPDSQWLATNKFVGGGLDLINVISLERLELVSSNFFNTSFLWSLDGHYLAFTQGTRIRPGVISSSLFLWNAESREVIPLTETYPKLHAAWSPDSQTIAIGFLADGEGVLMLLDVTNNAHSILQNVPGSTELITQVWSPDGQWLLFHNKNSNESGLYLIHQSGREVHQLVDTTDSEPPYAFYWLFN